MNTPASRTSDSTINTEMAIETSAARKKKKRMIASLRARRWGAPSDSIVKRPPGETSTEFGGMVMSAMLKSSRSRLWLRLPSRPGGSNFFPGVFGQWDIASPAHGGVEAFAYVEVDELGQCF